MARPPSKVPRTRITFYAPTPTARQMKAQAESEDRTLSATWSRAGATYLKLKRLKLKRRAMGKTSRDLAATS